MMSAARMMSGAYLNAAADMNVSDDSDVDVDVDAYLNVIAVDLLTMLCCVVEGWMQIRQEPCKSSCSVTALFPARHAFCRYASAIMEQYILLPSYPVQRKFRAWRRLELSRSFRAVFWAKTPG